jgi:CBS domain-containing protein
MKVEDAMTTDVVSVLPGESLKEVARIMVERRISGVPVVDGDGRLLGVVSEADLIVKELGAWRSVGGPLAWLVDPLEVGERLKLEARVAGEAMTSPAVTIEPHRSVMTAADRMLERGVNRLPVVVADRLVGILTRADLVRAFARADSEIAREIREDVVGEHMMLDEHAVEVDVEAGEVLLSGALGRRSQAELLPRLISRVPGVVGVHSRLTWREDDTR